MPQVPGGFWSLSVALATSLLGLAPPASARQLAPPPVPPPAGSTFEIAALTPDQDNQLATWVSAMEKWQKYDEKWRNRPVHNGWGGIGARKAPPDMPAWLPGHCGALAEAHLAGIDGRIEQGCKLVEDPRATLNPSLLAAQTAGENAKHSSFLTRVHLDGLWTTTQNGSRFYGIIGSHVSLVDVGRLQVFGPPGVMLLTVPNGHGGRRATFGYTWGLSLRLTDVRVGAPTKNLTLFLNVTKVFVASGASGAQATKGYDIVGFSLAPRKKR
jgi:hypothetical protein